MKPDKLSVYQLFEAQRRHVVPLFQRQYVWNQEEHWEPLWEDIVRQAEAAGRQEKVRPHFLGAVVLNQLPSVSKDIDTREIIDGQQRMTTLQVVLAAARHFAAAEGYSKLFGEFERLTINPLLKDSQHKFKIQPTRADEETFSAVMAGITPEELRVRLNGQGTNSKLPKLAAAYVFFLEQLPGFIQDGEDNGAEDRFWHFHSALRERLQMVVIDLDDTDDPQIIFETLNARGVPLLPSDLIRNFVLHRARFDGNNIDELYEEWWSEFDERRIEDSDRDDDLFWKKEVRQGRLKRPRLDLFFFHFLQYHSSRDFNISRLYQEFCEWWDANQNEGVETGLKIIRRESETFAGFLVPSGTARSDLFLDRLLKLDTSTVYPLLFAMLGPDAQWKSDAERDQAIVDLESYLVRRMICQLTTKNYNKFFMSLLRQTKEEGCSLEVIRSRLMSSEEKAVCWPTDEEVRHAWLHYKTYGYIRQDRIQMILEAIELEMYSDRQELLGLDQQTTIEHVMPQSWERSWRLPANAARKIVGEDGETMLHRRQRFVQTFGNLTLLTQKLNSAISNGPYKRKRNQITKQSVLKLNAYFQDVDTWDEDAILKRGNHLLELAFQVWPRPRK